LKCLPQQLVVALPTVLVAIESDVLNVKLALQLKEALRSAEPNRAGRGINATDDFVQKVLKKLSRG
jgi:hypothetical protein